MIEPRSAEASTTLPRRLAAVWFADIVGYTRLAAEDENAALAAVQRFEEIVREVVEARRGQSVGAPAAVVAGMFAEVGRVEEALPYLELALETRGLGVTGLGVNPRFDALREDPRFQAILVRCGLA